MMIYVQHDGSRVNQEKKIIDDRSDESLFDLVGEVG